MPQAPTDHGDQAGSYDVREVFQTGWTCSYPNAGPGDAAANGVVTSTDCEHTETFTSDDDLTNNNFGNWTAGSKSGQKFEDQDADGIKDASEGGLAGWTIYVDYNGNNSFDAGEPSGVTDGSGNYSIGGIAPGTYDVREVSRPAGRAPTPTPGPVTPTPTASSPPPTASTPRRSHRAPTSPATTSGTGPRRPSRA